jgi:glycosyltransferase involved in cell wall biosynthesis
MRIMIAGTYGERNGIETYTRHLVSALAGAGHEVFVADRSPGDPLTGPSSRAIRLPPRNWAIWRAAGPFEAVRAGGGLRRAVDDIAPDLVHVTYPELAPRVSVPMVVTVWHPERGILHRARTSRSRGERAKLGALFAASDRIAVRRSAGVAATTRTVARALGESSRVVWIPPFLPDSAVRAPASTRSHDCLMVAGKLDDPRKGLALAIGAVELLRRDDPTTRLVLIGGWGSGAPPSLPDFCEVRGSIPPDELGRAMREAGCLLMPSVFEEFGYVGLEALAAGTPVACTPLPGFEGLDTDGLVVAERRDPEDLRAAARAALRIEAFRFPAACRASEAMGRLSRLYDAASR